MLKLRDIEELDTDDAADLLGRTVSAVKSRRHRARQAPGNPLIAELGGDAMPLLAVG